MTKFREHWTKIVYFSLIAYFEASAVLFAPVFITVGCKSVIESSGGTKKAKISLLGENLFILEELSRRQGLKFFSLVEDGLAT